MAEAQSLPQPQPRQVAQYLHNAADQIALFENLPTFTNDQMLRENTRSIAALQEALQEVVRALNTIQNNMTTLNTTIGTLQNDMNQEFARLNTKLDSTDHNARARLDNSRVTSRDQALTVIKTTDNIEPRGFPATSGQLSSITAENLNRLLTAYGLDRDGMMEVKRRRFRTFIGIADIV